MKSSFGSASVSALRTVRPPIPESNTPTGRSIVARGPRIFPFDAASDFCRAAVFFDAGISSAREALAHCSRSRGRRAKHTLMYAGRFHAQVGGDFRALHAETLGQRAVQVKSQRCERAQAAVG